MFERLRRLGTPAQFNVERQELWCHGCENYVQFSMDLNMDGNHVLDCPVCGHQHYRVVRNGKITGIRWRNSAGTGIAVTRVTYSVTSTSDSTTSSSVFLQQAWSNRTSGT